MDQKTWLWRKRSSEKTIIANGKADFDLKGKAEEVFFPNEKEAALAESVKILNEKLASLTSECNAKEELLKDHAERAREAVAGKEKAKMEVLDLKRQLDEALQQKCAANDRLGNLNAALKDCMQQLSFVREEHEQRVQDAIVRTSMEIEKTHKKLEDKLAETSKKLASLTVENSQLSNTLQVKEKLIEVLSDRRSEVEAEFDALMVRLDSVEKENAFLRYEFRMLEKDLDIRNEEIKFTRRSADATDKNYLQSLNKVKKLEAECQRLRVLVRKRLPAPALLSNMRDEVEMQGRSHIETRRKLSPVTGGLVVRDSTRENLDISSKRISFLVERLQNVEQENKILRDVLRKKQNDSPIACTQIVPLSSQGEAQLGEHHKAEQSMELAVSGVNICGKHETNSSPSWNSTLISGLEIFKDGDFKKTSEHKMLGISDMSLMDDFVEMEKLAIVALDVPQESVCQNRVDSTGMELVPVGKALIEPQQQLQMSNSSSSRYCDWLQAVLKMIMEQVHVSAKSIDELLEDIKIALHAETYEAVSSTHSGRSELLPVSGYITWKSPATSPSVGSSKGVPDICSSLEQTSHEHIQSKNLELELQSSRDKSGALSSDLEQSQQNITSLRTELEKLSESKRMIEDQFENQKLINEELDTQLTVAKVRLNDVSQKLSSLEVELEDKSRCCEELEGTCIELQLQLQSVPRKDENEDQKLLQTGWEIKAASLKLAECEAAILNLGNQLKARTPPNEALHVNKVLCTPSKNNTKQLNQHFSLLDRMLSEDSLKPSQTKGLGTAETLRQPPYQTNSNRGFYTSGVQVGASGGELSLKNSATKSSALVILPSNKRGRGTGFLRRLLLWRKRGSSNKKKTHFSFAA